MLKLDLMFPLQGDPTHCGAVVVVLSSCVYLCRQRLNLLYMRIVFRDIYINSKKKKGKYESSEDHRMKFILVEMEERA